MRFWSKVVHSWVNNPLIQWTLPALVVFTYSTLGKKMDEMFLQSVLMCWVSSFIRQLKRSGSQWESKIDFFPSVFQLSFFASLFDLHLMTSVLHKMLRIPASCRDAVLYLTFNLWRHLEERNASLRGSVQYHNVILSCLVLHSEYPSLNMPVIYHVFTRENSVVQHAHSWKHCILVYWEHYHFWTTVLAVGVMSSKKFFANSIREHLCIWASDFLVLPVPTVVIIWKWKASAVRRSLSALRTKTVFQIHFLTKWSAALMQSTMNAYTHTNIHRYTSLHR